MKAAIIASFCLASLANALEVHEWGTFTVLSGSNGPQVPWYQPSSDLAKLPAFVSSSSAGKSTPSIIRMETPVIYFYPEKEMKVSVDVSFLSGSVTETFPFTRPDAVRVDPGNGALTLGKWSGTLHPPTDKTALAEIPAIPESDHLEPYGAAREVPDAWIFESDLKEIPGREVQPRFPQMEKFIFYRGAGDAHIPVSASVMKHTVTVTNDTDSILPYGIALRVRDGRAAWAPIPPVPARPTNGSPATNRAEVTFPIPDRPLDAVESELANEWKKALAADGLTPAEASAMVETWRKTWFRESGDRVLTLVPRKITDWMLPLQITPAPEKTERVFVARIEMISPEREQALVELLNSEKQTDAEQFAEFRKLELGRFGNGAMEIATRIQIREMQRKYFDLRNFGERLNTSGR